MEQPTTAGNLNSSKSLQKKLFYYDETFNALEGPANIYKIPKNNNNSTKSIKSISNMLPSIYTIVKTTFTLILLIQQQQQCFAITETTAVTGNTKTTSPPTTKNSLTSVIATTKKATPISNTIPPEEYFECNSMDIRNHCDNFYRLENCTVITGYLTLVLIGSIYPCNMEKYHFPKLREITDFILLTDVRQLKSVRSIFPNLTVIRGRRVFVNFAMGVFRMQDMTEMEFPSLIAMQRGHFFVGNNENLCFLKTINFDRITLSIGENHIIPENVSTCPVDEQPCKGCDSGYCWSNKVCQKFENDNILNYTIGIQHCDPQCLGGCNNRTNQGCAVCRTWTDHGVCVDRCPADKYASDHFLRCYTREECIAKRQYIFKNECVGVCPGGYKLNNATGECDSCGGVNDCRRVCYPPKTVDSLSDVEYLRGCQIINGSLIMYLRYRINEQEFFDNLKDVQEIMGYLKIYNSPHVPTLSFFQSLVKIHGLSLENNHHSLIIFNNARLEELWPTQKNVELVNGGIYIARNDRLCNRVVRKFKNSVKHDHNLDSIILSDLEVLCSPEKLIVGVEVLSHKSFKLSWLKDSTTEEIEIIYQPVVGNKPPLVEHNKLEIPVCDRIHWQRELILVKDLGQNDTHYSYVVDELQPHSKYRCMVKTFGSEDSHEARSELKVITTLADIPVPPTIKVYKKAFDSLSVQWSYDNHEDELVDFYRLEVYEMPDKKEILDQRDYCEDPLKPFNDFHNEDYDDCCSRRQENRDDELFESQLRKEFACSLEHKENCERISLDDPADNNGDALLIKRFEHRETNYTIRSLERFYSYSLRIQACNHAGCGSFNIITERTNFSAAAEKLYDLTGCKMAHNMEYQVRFKEPKTPNGLIVSYTLHYRFFDSGQGPFKTHVHCITRLEHENNNFLYVTELNDTYNQISVRVQSLGHHLFTEWVNISQCGEVEEVVVPVTKEESHTPVLNVFFIFFLVGCTAGISWVCYKRRCWCSLPGVKRYVPVRLRWTNMISTNNERNQNDEDNQILVENYETVRFHNVNSNNRRLE